MYPKPSYAFFDFDGTLISQDSFLILLKAGLLKQPWRILFLILFSPAFFATVIFKLDKSLAKSLILWALTVFRGRKGSIHFLKSAVLKKSTQIWFLEAVSQLEELKKNNVEIIVISASGNAWIRALLMDHFKNFRLIIGSRLGFYLGGVILKSKNCYNEEKLLRIKEHLGENFNWHSAWSDHIADLPMLKKAPTRYIICPRKKHKSIFEEELHNNFTLLNWTTKG